MRIKFGVAGFPPNFFESPLKRKRDNIFEWLHDIGLEWIELQNTYGVKMPDEQAYRYRMLSEKYGIGISIHAPYFISFGSKKPDVVERSKQRMVQCFHLAEKLGSNRIIFHPGYPPGKTADMRKLGIESVITCLNELEKFRPDGVYVYPETAGKRNQMGSIDEIACICNSVDYARPCLDLAHVHAFEGGALTTPKSIKEKIDFITNAFGQQYKKVAHFHMYPVEYDGNGEKRHRAFGEHVDECAEEEYAPTAEDFIMAIQDMDLDAVVICEARDTQDVGAIKMQKLLSTLS